MLEDQTPNTAENCYWRPPTPPGAMELPEMLIAFTV